MEISNLVWCCAVGFMLSGLIGLGEVGLEIWLVLHYTSLAGLTGIMVYFSYVFLASGGLASLNGLLGFGSSIKMKRYFLLLSIPLMVLSIICQAAALISTYIVQIQVATDLLDNLNGTEVYNEILDHQYNCQLQNSSEQNYEFQLKICSSFLSRQLWIYVYSLLVLCVSLICLQGIVVLLAAKLNMQLKKRNNRVDSIAQMDDPPPHHETPPNFIRSPRPSTASHVHDHHLTTPPHPLKPDPPPAPSRRYSTPAAFPSRQHQPPPSAPPRQHTQLQPITTPPVAYPPPPQYSHSSPTFDPALLPDASRRGNFNHTNPLPRIPSYGDQHPMLYDQNQSPAAYEQNQGHAEYEQNQEPVMYEQNQGPADWGDIMYQQSQM